MASEELKLIVTTAILCQLFSRSQWAFLKLVPDKYYVCLMLRTSSQNGGSRLENLKNTLTNIPISL